jgi:hypothetical protein
MWSRWRFAIGGAGVPGGLPVMVGLAARAGYERQWTSAGFRDSSRRMTAVWGLALIADASLRVALSFLISPATLMLISPLLTATVFGSLAAWSLHRRSARLRAQRAVPTA